jgi:adenylate kinase
VPKTTTTKITAATARIRLSLDYEGSLSLIVCLLELFVEIRDGIRHLFTEQHAEIKILSRSQVTHSEREE